MNGFTVPCRMHVSNHHIVPEASRVAPEIIAMVMLRQVDLELEANLVYIVRTCL